MSRSTPPDSPFLFETIEGPDFSFETGARRDGFWPVAGTDEAGRGPLAGPVVAAAVILDPDNIPEGLNDSKQLSIARREELFDIILSSAIVSIASSGAAGSTARISARRASMPCAAPCSGSRRALRSCSPMAATCRRGFPAVARPSSRAMRGRCRLPPPRSSPRWRAIG